MRASQTAVPTIEGDHARLQAPILGRGEHRTKVGIFGLAVHRLIVEPIVAGDRVCAITLQQGDQVDTRNHAMVLARPVAMDQRNLLGIGFVEGSVVDDQETIMQDDMLLCLVPERRGIGSEAMEEAGQGIMSRSSWGIGLDASGFGAGEDHGRGNQKIDVLEVSDFGLVHLSTIPHNASTA